MIGKYFFQKFRVRKWLEAVFGYSALSDVEERMIRLGEEVIELGQAEGLTKEQWLALVEQVYAKEPGDVFQEQGGVMVTLAAYAAVKDVDLYEPFAAEMTRCEQPEVMKKIHEKHATKAVVSSRYR